VKAIERRHRSYSFPRWLAFFLAVFHCLPPRLADAIVSWVRFRKLRQRPLQLGKIDAPLATPVGDRGDLRALRTRERNGRPLVGENILEIRTGPASRRMK